MVHKTVWIMICAVLAYLQHPQPLGALEEYSRLADRVRSTPVSIQARSMVTLASPGAEGNYDFLQSTTLASSSNTEITVTTDGPNTRSMYRMDRYGTILEYETVTKPGANPGSKGQKGSGPMGGGTGDRVYTAMKRLPDGTYRQTIRKKDGTEESSIMTLSGKDILFVQLPYAIQKAIKSGMKEGFNFDGVFGPSFRQNFDLRFIQTSTPMQTFSQYRYPPAIASALGTLDIAVVAELGVTGIASLIYPHKMYLAYGKAPDYFLRAFWGGEPGKDFFQVEVAQ